MKDKPEFFLGGPLNGKDRREEFPKYKDHDHIIYMVPNEITIQDLTSTDHIEDMPPRHLYGRMEVGPTRETRLTVWIHSSVTKQEEWGPLLWGFVIKAAFG